MVATARLLLALPLTALGLACGPREVEPAATGAVLWITGEHEVALEPAAALDDAGRLWVLWIEFLEQRRAPNLSCAWLENGVLLGRESLAIADGDLAVPSLAPFGNGIYAVWEAAPVEGGAGLFGCALSLEGGALIRGPIETITPPGARPLSPSLARTGPARLELVWQREGQAGYRIDHAVRADGAWSEPAALIDDAGDAWRPRAAAAAGGSLHLVWDAFDGESFDVFHALVRDGRLERRTPVATGPAYQAYPELAVDPEGCAWVAYEEAPQFGEIGALRERRVARLARVDPRSDPGLSHALAPLGELARERSDLPRIAAGAGGVALACRVPVPEAPRSEGVKMRYADFFTHCTTFDAQGRASARELRESEGGNAASETLVIDGRGTLWCVFTGDGRGAHVGEVNTYGFSIEQRWRLGVARLAGPTGLPRLGPGAPDSGRRAPARRAPRAPDAGGPNLLFGDLHRHTELSQCAGRQDGLTLDAFRYARGPGALDFIALSEHFQHLRPWSWWRHLRDVERYHSPPHLVTLPATERNVVGAGHQNLIFSDRAAAFLDHAAFEPAPARIADLDLGGVLSIPHMMTLPDNPFRWTSFQPELHRLVEVYQGNRGSFEGVGLPYEVNGRQIAASALFEGLGGDRHLGLIGASDHSATADGLAGVWASAASRAAIFEALRARRTFAATDPVHLDVWLAGLHAGQSGAVSPDAAVVVQTWPRAALDGEQPQVAYVEIVKNGRLHGRRDGGADPAAARLLVLTSRFRRATDQRPLRVEVRGGHFTRAAGRGSGETGVEVRLTEEGVLELTKVHNAAHAVFELVPAAGADPELTVGFLDQRARVRLAEIEPGHSVPLADLDPDLEHLWNLGVPLASPAVRVEFQDPLRQPGDSYYARVAWTDGALAWTSPIRVTEIEER